MHTVNSNVVKKLSCLQTGKCGNHLSIHQTVAEVCCLPFLFDTLEVNDAILLFCCLDIFEQIKIAKLLYLK